jgi:hypothetical protein
MIQYTFWAKFRVLSVKVGGAYIQVPRCFDEVEDNGEETDRFYFTKKKGNKRSEREKEVGGGLRMKELAVL